MYMQIRESMAGSMAGSSPTNYQQVPRENSDRAKVEAELLKELLRYPAASVELGHLTSNHKLTPLAITKLIPHEIVKYKLCYDGIAEWKLSWYD